jgi:hypothetical protein
MGEWIHSWHPGVSISPRTQSLVWHILLRFLNDLGLTELVEQGGGGGEEQRWEGPCSVFIGGRLKAVDCDAAIDKGGRLKAVDCDAARSIKGGRLMLCLSSAELSINFKYLRKGVFRRLPPKLNKKNLKLENWICHPRGTHVTLINHSYSFFFSVVIAFRCFNPDTFDTSRGGVLGGEWHTLPPFPSSGANCDNSPMAPLALPILKLR